MSESTYYNVVSADGKEHNHVNLETIKEWYCKRQLNDTSLIFSFESGKWQMLKKVFDIEEFQNLRLYGNPANNQQGIMPPAAAQAHSAIRNEHGTKVHFYGNESHDNPAFGGSGMAAPPDTQAYHQDHQAGFTQPVYQENNYRQGGYRQGGYSESNPGGQRQFTSYLPAYEDYENSGSDTYRSAAYILLASGIIGIAFVILEFMGIINVPGDSGPIRSALSAIIPIVVDLLLANYLWEAAWYSKARRFAIAKAYLSLVLGILFAFLFAVLNMPAIGFSFLGYAGAYSIGLLVVLHGKASPGSGRKLFGKICVGAMIIFSFLFVISLSGFSGHKILLASIEKYKMPGDEFKDLLTGTQIKLPSGWRLYDPQNPQISTPISKMVALQSKGSAGAMFEVYTFPQMIDFSKTGMPISEVLDKGEQGILEKMRQQIPSYHHLSSSPITIGSGAGKRVVFGKNGADGKKIMGHVVFTVDSQYAYTLQMWCDEKDYPAASKDFVLLENSLSIPTMPKGN